MRDFHTLKTFAGEDVFHVVVESPRGSGVKLKYSPDLWATSISRPLVLGITYPCDWGFVRQRRVRTAIRSTSLSGGM